MKTSCFKKYKGNNGVAISLYIPTLWTGEVYKALAPTPSIFYDIKAGRIDTDEYTRRYNLEVLEKLDPQQVFNDLKDKVLLCYEMPGDFCHRRLVAEWLFANLGVFVPEWNKLDDIKTNNNIKPLF